MVKNTDQSKQITLEFIQDWNNFAQKIYGTKAEYARALKEDPGNLSNFLSGNRNVTRPVVKKAARLRDVSTTDICPSFSGEPKTAIPVGDVYNFPLVKKLADINATDATIEISVPRITVTDAFIIFEVQDNAMAPKTDEEIGGFVKGDYALVNTDQTSVNKGQYVLAEFENELILRQVVGKALVAKNSLHRDILDNYHIVGVVKQRYATVDL